MCWPEFLGIDTSNYTTSVAVLNAETGIIKQSKKLLPVKKGQAGLRQSDALFHHVNQFTEVSDKLLNNMENLKAVGVSAFPRNISGSYMPCFLAGKMAAEAISAVTGAKLYYTSHQAGHIAAALYSCKRLDLLYEPFIAFHLSGGTTDCLYCTPDEENIIDIQLFSSSLDLKAGQAVDRTGLMLEFKIKPSLKGNDCSLSGIENKCRKMLDDKALPEDIAKFCLTYIGKTVCAMAQKAQNALGELSMVFAGGVMSNKYIREMILNEREAYFAEPEYSCDNAAGVAVIAFEKYKKMFSQA